MGVSATTGKFLSQPPRLWIGGAATASSADLLDVENPACGQRIAQVPLGTSADVDAAVGVAQGAWRQGWRDCDAAARGDILWRIADAIEADTETLAELETLDNGKPLAFARSDVRNAAKHFR